MLTGIIDVGSNSMRLSIFKHEADGTFLPVTSRKIIAGLVGYERNGKLTAKGEAKLCKCLMEFRFIIDALEVTDVHAIATAVFRRVINAREVSRRVYKKTGFKLEILSGEEEARLSYLGARYSTNIKKGLVVDVGGASSEMIKVVGDGIGDLCSVPIGCLWLSLQANQHIFPSKDDISKMKAIIKQQLASAQRILEQPSSTLCFVGGTARAAYRIAREIKFRDTRTIEPRELSHIIRGFGKRDEEILQAVSFAAPERVFTLFAGLLIMQAVVDASKSTTLWISKCGVREGYLIDNIIKC